jgi:HD-GYP domain-containing protein (c-di-GMP phosphodiesterase class II)
MSSILLTTNDEERTLENVMLRIAGEADTFEAYAHPHATRIARIADELAQRFSLARQDRFSLRLAALAHDIGELKMAREYIRRRNALSDEENLDMMRHPVIGEQEAAKNGATRGTQLLIRWHHEWWNGSGYPDGLSREQIPLAARILRVADAYAAMTDERPYQPAVSLEKAKLYLKQWAGLEFDPNVVRVFLTLEGFDELRSYADKVQEMSPKDNGFDVEQIFDEITIHQPAEQPITNASQD